MHAFDWIILVNISLTGLKMVANKRKHGIFLALYELQTLKNIMFSVFMHINLPGKCVFSAVNSGEFIVVHSENANERKENTLFAMC